MNLILNLLIFIYNGYPFNIFIITIKCIIIFSDYFNYGFNESTWLAYCERQRKMRCNESLVGMATLALHNQQVSANTTNNMIPTLEVKPAINNTKFQAPNVPPKENTIEVCIFRLLYTWYVFMYTYSIMACSI